MPLPTDDLIIWASSDVNLPNLAGPNKVKPIDDLILKGWDFKQKPAADEFNYVLNNLGMHVSYLEESKTYTFTGDVTGSVVSSGSEDFSVNLQVADNSHNHTSANISDATSANNANMVVKRGASGEVSVGDLTVSKVGGVSTVNFPGTSTDPGYIKHSETNDVSRMQFSISDNNDSNDKFEFGNTQGGSFVPRFTIDANGTTNVESSVTATNFIGPLQGNALTAATWQTSRTITLSGDVSGSVSMNGGSNVTITTSVADNSHNHTSANISDATSTNTPNRVVRRDVNGDMAANYIRAEAYFDGDLQGNADTASALKTARTISISGNGSGSVSFNGTSNISIPLVIADNSHNHISANISDATSSNAAFMIVKRDANGGISIGDLTVNKLSNTSTIIFPASANDPGFIKHIENPADTCKLQFSISDNSSTDDLYEFGNTQGGSFTPTFTITSSGIATGSNGQLHSVSVLTGTISRGGTIPLPSGYSEGQCRWMVSMNNDNASDIGWDIDEDGAHVHYKQQVYTTGRVVTAQTYLGSNNSTPGWIPSTANYIIIGVK